MTHSDTCAIEFRMTVEMDPCPFCGRNRKLVGYSHRCTPQAPQFTPGQVAARAAVDVAIGQYKEEAAIPPEVVAAVATKQAGAKLPRSLRREPKRRPPSPEVVAVAAQIEEKRAAKVSREGKKSFTVWIDEGLAYQIKIAAAKHKTTQEAIVGEGIAAMLAAKYKP